MSNNVMGSISIERLHSIEREREEIRGSIEFQKWVSELNVSRSYVDMSPVWKAREMNECYEFKRLKS